MVTHPKNDDAIDYTPEGSTPPHEKKGSTDAGYDEAVLSGPSKYGVAEGQGGVFGTTGGGTFNGGMHIEGHQAAEERAENERNKSKKK